MDPLTAALASMGIGLAGSIGGAIFGQGQNDQYRQQLQQLAQQYGNRQAPQAGPAAQAGYSGFRSNQQSLIAQLEEMAKGNGPSAAEAQMRDAMRRAAATQASAAAGAGGRGVNAGAALRQAANNTAAMQSQAAADTGMERVQEQLGALGQLGGAIAQGRSADEGINQFNAGQQNTVSAANLEARLRTLGLNQQGQLQALMAAMGIPNAGQAIQGLGNSLLAGGASMVPGALQYDMAQRVPNGVAAPDPTMNPYGLGLNPYYG
jgi:hypothetical protein